MADVFTLDSNYIASIRKRIANDVAYAQYKVGSSWHKAKIESAEVLSDGRIEVKFIIDHTISGNITVTSIELYDHEKARIGSRVVSITRADATEGILYVCRFNVFQVVENKGKTGTYDKLS